MKKSIDGILADITAKNQARSQLKAANAVEGYNEYLARYNKADAELEMTTDLSDISAEKREKMTRVLMEINAYEAAEVAEAEKLKADELECAVRGRLAEMSLAAIKRASTRVRSTTRAAQNISTVRKNNPKLFAGRNDARTIAAMLAARAEDDVNAEDRHEALLKEHREKLSVERREHHAANGKHAADVVINLAEKSIKFEVAGVEYPTLKAAVDAAKTKGEAQ